MAGRPVLLGGGTGVPPQIPSLLAVPAPATPSGLRPLDPWNHIRASRSMVPNDPSTVTWTNPRLNRACSTHAAAGPVLPSWTVTVIGHVTVVVGGGPPQMPSRIAVAAPATPSVPKPLAPWNHIRLSRSRALNDPSTVTFVNPRLDSASSTQRVSSPVVPRSTVVVMVQPTADAVTAVAAALVAVGAAVVTGAATAVLGGAVAAVVVVVVVAVVVVALEVVGGATVVGGAGVVVTGSVLVGGAGAQIASRSPVA